MLLKLEEIKLAK